MLHIRSSYSSGPHPINTDGILPSAANTNPLRFHWKCVTQQEKTSSFLGAMKTENTKFSFPHPKIRYRYWILPSVSATISFPGLRKVLFTAWTTIPSLLFVFLLKRECERGEKNEHFSTAGLAPSIGPRQVPGQPSCEGQLMPMSRPRHYKRLLFPAAGRQQALAV